MQPPASEFSLDLLSERERDVLRQAAEGLTDDGIAQALGLSSSTVNSYWVRIRGKIGPYSRTDMVARMLRHEARLRMAELMAENRRLMEELSRQSERFHELCESQALLRGKAWVFRTLVHLPEAVFVAGPPANVVFANRRASRLYGAHAGEMDGLPLQELTVVEAAADPLHEMLEPDGPQVRTVGVDTAYYARRRDGTNFRAVLRAERFETEEGPRAAVVVREFMDETIQMVEALRRPMDLV